MTNWDFACSDPVDISIDSWASGSIVVAGEPTSRVTVEVRAEPASAPTRRPARAGPGRFEDGQLYVHGPRVGYVPPQEGPRPHHQGAGRLQLRGQDRLCRPVLRRRAQRGVAAYRQRRPHRRLGPAMSRCRRASGDVLLNKAGGNSDRSIPPPATSRPPRSTATSGSTPPAAMSPSATAPARSPPTPPAATSSSARRRRPGRAGQRLRRPRGRRRARARRLPGPRQQLAAISAANSTPGDDER